LEANRLIIVNFNRVLRILRF